MKLLHFVVLFFSLLPLLATERMQQQESNSSKSIYIKTSSHTDLLTKEERAWIQSHPTITLASTEDYTHLASRDEQGIIRGFDADLIEQINKNLSITLSLKLFKGWEDAYAAASNGKVDGILSLSHTPERESTFLFSPVYHNDPTYIVTRKTEYGISTIHDFNGKTVTTEQDNIINDIIAKEAPEAKIIHAPTMQDIFYTIQNKQSDGALIEGMENYNLEAFNLKIAGTIFTKSGEYTIGVHKKNPLLGSIITKGIQSISKNQMQQMKNRWFNKVSQNALFSDEELLYIKNAPVIRVGVENWAPMISTKDGKTIEGIVGELLTRVLQISGLKTELFTDEWNILLTDFKENKLDVLPSTYYTEERATFGLFGDAYTNINNVLYINKDNQTIKSFADLAGKKLAIQKSFGTIDTIRQKFPNIIIIETPTLQDAILKVSNQEADALFEAQIVAEEYIKQLLITNLKPIYQNSIENTFLHFFSKKNDPLLHSILNKALQSIPPQEKNNIIDKWLHPNIKKNIAIAFGKDKEPYSSDQALMRGIEYELVQSILEKSSIVIGNEKYLSKSELQTALFDDLRLDAVVGVKPKNDGLYHSNTLIEFENIAITRMQDHTNLQTLDDLKDKTILAFAGASQELETLLSIPSLNYSETDKPENQINALLAKKVDVIIMDKNIFFWYLKKLHGGNSNQYKLHYLFDKNNSYEIAFKDKNTRDTFNLALQEFKKTKEYSDIFYNYLYTDIESKTKIGTLISALLAKSIFKEDIKKIYDIVTICSTLPYLQKIEVLNNEGELLVSHIKSKSQIASRFDSFHSIANTPHKVGSIALYFDDEKLKNYTRNHAIIPHVSLFQPLSYYQEIKEVYKKFDYLDALFFTEKEEEFIRKHPIITFSALKNHPLYMQQKEIPIGLYTEFTKLIEQKTGMTFKYTFAASQDELYQQFNAKDVQLIADAKDPDLPLLKKALASDEFITFKLAIVSRNDGKIIKSLGEMQGSVVVAKNSSAHSILMHDYPHIPLVIAENSSDALMQVSQNKANLCVGEEEELGHFLQDEFPYLKVVGVSQERVPHIFIVHDEHPELISIINKILDFIPFEQQQNMKEQWVKAKINAEVDYSIVYKIAGTLLGIIFLGFIYNKRLKYLVDKKTFELETLLDSYDENVIAAKVDEHGRIIYISDALSRISGYSKEELEKDWINLLANKTHPHTLKELKKAFIQKVSWKGELISQSQSGELCWTETMIFPEYSKEGKFLHHTIISQDITSQKEVEHLYKEIEDTQKEIIFKMGAIAEARSQETGAHVKRVAEYSKVLALAYGLSQDEASIIKLASPMHDIGKIGIADSILNKKGRLSEEEFTIMKTHAELGYEMLKNSHRTLLKAAAIIAYEHHEKYDGTGYPRELKGEEIHIYGRITAIADVFDALGSKRVYKEAWDEEAILDYFREERGLHFDPKLVDLLFENLPKIQEIKRSFKDD